MEKSVKDRLLEFLEHKNIGQGAFEKSAGISNGYVNNLKGSIGSKISKIWNKVGCLYNYAWMPKM